MRAASSFADRRASVADADIADVPITVAVIPDLAADIAIRAVHRRPDPDAEAREEAVMVMVVVMMVVMILHELQQRTRLLCGGEIVGGEHRARIVDRLEQFGVGLRRGDRSLNRSGLRGAGKANCTNGAHQEGRVFSHVVSPRL